MSIRFKAVGFDTEAATTRTARTFTFRSEGPGVVSAHVTHASEGEVRLCLKADGGTEQCRESDKIDLSASTDEPGKTRWTVSAIGLGGGAPIADIRIAFNSSTPAITIDGFRFQGVQDTGYNGVEIEFNTGPGSVHAMGTWEGAARPWRALLTNTDTGESLADESGQGNKLVVEGQAPEGRVHLSLTNTEDFSDQEVFLHAVIRWTGPTNP